MQYLFFGICKRQQILRPVFMTFETRTTHKKKIKSEKYHKTDGTFIHELGKIKERMMTCFEILTRH